MLYWSGWLDSRAGFVAGGEQISLTAKERSPTMQNKRNE
jgi:hypothetical protein